MRITFLGGADEVGASSLLVETATARFLVDCGLRMGGAGRRDPLPDLAAIEDPGRLDAILVTHAHLDHSGALPLLHAAAQEVPVLATAATLDLLAILLVDAAKIQGQRFDREEELPLYPPGATEALMARARPVPYLEVLEVAPGHEVTFFPAGHVLGAAAVGVETPEGRLLVTGDLSVDDQRTIPGMLAPRYRPDVVIAESTYGGRLHASRPLEERRLVETVAETVRAGGKVLIPAFALGRAQEVILILEDALRRKLLPAVPIHVDGMVKGICGVYAGHPDLLRPGPRKRCSKGHDPFFGPGAVARPVTGPAERSALLEGGPCVIVASSGMLSGGPSVGYAAALLPDPANLVCITGYQDEEAPGRRLLAAAEGETDTLTVGGVAVPVKARITKYVLSAHADSSQIGALLGALRPRDVAFVHGDDGARAAIARACVGVPRGDLLLPALGESFERTYRRGKLGAGHPRGSTGSPGGISGGRPLDERGLEDLWLHLVQKEGTGKPRTLGSLLTVWYGQSAWGRDERLALAERLAVGKAGYAPDKRRPFLYRLVDPDGPCGFAVAGAPSSQQEILDVARTAFGPDTGLLRCGLDPDGAVILYFAFPLRATTLHAERIEKLSVELGAVVRLHPETNLQALEAAAAAALPLGVIPVGNASVRREQHSLTLRVAGMTDAALPAVEGARNRFREATGFTLHLEESAKRSSPGVGSYKVDDAGRLEINAAYARLRELFAASEDRPDKFGKKSEGEGEYIELGFISPEVGARCKELIARGEADTGWSLRVGKRVDQQALIRIARELAEPLGGIVKGPSVHLTERVVKVKLASLPASELLDEVRNRFLARTGFDIEVLRG